MSGEEESNYTFVCPECDEALEVNLPMKDALISKGCVICGARVTTRAFTATSPPGST